MFSFLEMVGNYEQRKVGRYDHPDGWFISTALVTDSEKPFVTAVCHPKYNEGRIVIVDSYDNKMEAEAGHEKWVQTMNAETLPERLVDVSEAGIAQLMDVLGGTDWRTLEIDGSDKEDQDGI